MKKLFALILLIMSVSVHAQIEKAAIISVFGNKNLSDDPLDTKIYEALLKDSSFDISGTVNDFENILIEKIVPSFAFPFANKEEIISSADYQALDEIVTYRMKYDLSETGQEIADFFQPIVPADGYVNIAAFGVFLTDKEAILRTFEIFPDLDAVMIAYIDFNLYDAVGAMGISSKKVYAYVNVKLFNREGKRIFRVRERATSSKGVTAIGGFVVDPDKLKPMIFDASEKLFAEMQGKMPKSIAKMAKKIDKNAGEDDN